MLEVFPLVTPRFFVQMSNVVTLFSSNVVPREQFLNQPNFLGDEYILCLVNVGGKLVHLCLSEQLCYLCTSFRFS